MEMRVCLYHRVTCPDGCPLTNSAIPVGESGLLFEPVSTYVVFLLLFGQDYSQWEYVFPKPNMTLEPVRK